MAMPRTTIVGGGFSVLEDPTGTRARWMRRAGRGVFIVFLCWLLALVLGGLGLAPIGGIPLAHSLRPSAGPAPLAKLPQPRQPSASDLRPARPAVIAAATGTASETAKSNPVQQAYRSETAPGQTKTTTAAAQGRSATAPGQTKTTTTAAQGRSATAPGQTKTTTTAARGRSTTAPGQTKTTTPAAATTTGSHGRSSSAPGKQKR
jgi:hypothetical protein